MMRGSVTDTIILVSLLYFFYQGWRRGFLGTLVGPVSLVIGLMTAFFYYQKTQNLILSLLISILGPFILNIAFRLTLALWKKVIGEETSLSLMSRFLGSCLNILWRGTWLILILIFIAMMPANIPVLKRIQEDVTHSTAHALIAHWLGDKVPGASLDIQKVSSAFQDPAALKEILESEEVQAILTNEKFREVLSDEKVAEDLREKNYSALLTSPKMQTIFQDKELMQKFFTIQKEIMKNYVNKKEAGRNGD